MPIVRVARVARSGSFSDPIHRLARASVTAVGAFTVATACAATDGAGPSGSQAPAVVWQNAGYLGSAIPVFDERSVYFLGRSHDVTAVDKSTGALRWHVNLPVARPTQQGRGLRLAGGRLVVGDLDVFGLDPVTGAIAWQYRPTVGRQPGVFTLTAADGVVFTGSAGGYVYALDPVAGTARWAAALVDDTTASVFDPVVRDGVVYAGVTQFHDTGPLATGLVGAIDAGTGRILWRTALPSRDPNATGGLGTGTIGAAAIRDVIVTASGEGIIFGLDRVTGAVRWTAPAALDPDGKPRPSDRRPIAATGDVVFIGSGAGTITALAPDGRQLWTTSPGLGSTLYLSSDPQLVYATHGGGQLAAMDVETGRVRWIIGRNTLLGSREEEIGAPPAREGDRLYLGGLLVGLYALQLR